MNLTLLIVLSTYSALSFAKLIEGETGPVLKETQPVQTTQPIRKVCKAYCFAPLVPSFEIQVTTIDPDLGLEVLDLKCKAQRSFRPSGIVQFNAETPQNPINATIENSCR